MARMMNSTTPGKSWQIGATKSHRGFIVGTAVEGEYKVESGGMRSFSYIMFDARRETVVTNHRRATSKAMSDALDRIHALLVEKGLVSSPETFDY